MTESSSIRLSTQRGAMAISIPMVPYASNKGIGEKKIPPCPSFSMPQGPACHCGRSAPAAMGDPKWSCWRSVLLATCSSWTTSSFHWRVWRCLILQITNYIGWTLPGCASPWLVIGTSWNVTSSPSSSFTSSSRTEWILRGLWDAYRCFTLFSPGQWWLSCACALHFLARYWFHSDDVAII